MGGRKEEEESPKRFLTKQVIYIAGALIAAAGTFGGAYLTAHAGGVAVAGFNAVLR
jgi:hypothetical protein